MGAATRTVESLLRDGAAALNAGDPRAALDAFTACADAAPANAAAWLGKALSFAHLNDAAGALAALDTVLGLEPTNFRALILKGDQLAKGGDARAAGAFYAAGARRAPPLDSLPPTLRAEVERAAASAQALADAFERRLRDHLAGDAAAIARSPRFAKSLDLMTGKRRLYQQQPRFYCFPDLPQIEFYDRRDFPWAPAVEAATPAIRAELERLMARDGAFSPYVQQSGDRPGAGQGLVDNPDWGACYLIKNGARVEEVAAQCPATMAALSAAPLAVVPGRTPSVLFSLLRPGMRIPPHHGFVNTRLICHLPLIVPGACALRVGGETRAWREGELLIFDDTMEHEAWNLSDRVRVVLLFDVWRPELTEEERMLVTAMFRAIDASGAHAPDWD
ncbi:MAG: aspartyl/asparaginyl beta-hydroxylase domain-containing protein [Alphaproteobacteria bacterium]|nr:aspartyl/asparaginyl beta-hydroxylase domain-containing protein [Alphaproteobacteria bacterium]